MVSRPRSMTQSLFVKIACELDKLETSRVDAFCKERMPTANMFLVHGRLVSVSVTLWMWPGPGSFPTVKSRFVAPGAIYPVSPSGPSADTIHPVRFPIACPSDYRASCRVPS